MHLQEMALNLNSTEAILAHLAFRMVDMMADSHQSESAIFLVVWDWRPVGLGHQGSRVSWVP